MISCKVSISASENIYSIQKNVIRAYESQKYLSLQFTMKLLMENSNAKRIEIKITSLLPFARYLAYFSCFSNILVSSVSVFPDQRLNFFFYARVFGFLCKMFSFIISVFDFCLSSELFYLGVVISCLSQGDLGDLRMAYCAFVQLTNLTNCLDVSQYLNDTRHSIRFKVMFVAAVITNSHRQNTMITAVFEL